MTHAPAAVLDHTRFEDPDTEHAVLAAVLMDPGSVPLVAPPLEDSNFTGRINPPAFAAILRLHAAGSPIDILTVHAEMARHGDPTEGVKDHLARISDCVSSPDSVVAHAGILVDLARRRGVVMVLERELRRAQGGVVAFSDIAANLRCALDVADGRAAGARLPAPISVREMIAAPEPDEPFIVEGFVPADANLLLAAYPKSHKTNLVLALAVGAAAQLPVLGRFAVPRRHRVGLVLMEDRSHRVRRRLRRLCEGAGIALEDLDGYLHTWFRPKLRLTDAGIMDQLRAHIERHDLDLLWIDSWAYVAVGNSNEDHVVSPQLDALTRLRDFKPGLAVGLTHHAKKTQGPNSGSRLTDIIRNSSHFSAWYDSGYVLERADETKPVTVRAEMRDLPAPASFTFTVEDEHPGQPEQGIAPSGWMRLRAMEGSPITINRNAAAAALVPAVREFLAAHPGTSKNKLREGIDKNALDVEAALEMLVAAGVARIDHPDGKGKAARCWPCVPTSSDLVRTSSETNSGSTAKPRPIALRHGRGIQPTSTQQEIPDFGQTRFLDDPKGAA